MTTALIILVLLVVAIYLLRSDRSDSVPSSGDFISLIHPQFNGWSGFVYGDSHKFVLSRLKHLGLRDKEGAQNSFAYYGEVGSAPILCPTTRFTGVERIGFNFYPDDELKSISFFFEKEYSTKLHFTSYKSKLTERFGDPFFDGEENGGACVARWKGITLSLLADAPRGPQLLVLLSPEV